MEGTSWVVPAPQVLQGRGKCADIPSTPRQTVKKIQEEGSKGTSASQLFFH